MDVGLRDCDHCWRGDHPLREPGGATEGAQGVTWQERELSWLSRRLVIGLACGVISVSAVVGCSTSSDGDASGRGEELLSEVPDFPGASLVGSSTEPYTPGDESDPTGFVTFVEYDVPPGTTASEIRRFYVERVSGDWTLTEERSLCADCEPGEGQIDLLVFQREDVTLSVHLDALGRGRLELAIDVPEEVT